MRQRLWSLVDPRLADPGAAASMQQILDLVRSDWTLDTSIDLDRSPARELIIEHRISTLIPLDRVPASQREGLRTRQINIAAAQLRLRSVAHELIELLGHAGIETRVLKGLATADLDYPDRLQRHTGDVDLAILPDYLERTMDLLRGQGYRDHFTPYSRHLLYGWTFDGPHGVEVDIHTRLFRRSPLSVVLFAEPGEPLTSLPALALPLAQRLVHAAGHFIISPPGTRRMSGLVDLTRMLQNPNLDLADARKFAAVLGVESLVGAGLRVEAELSGRAGVLEQLDLWRSPDWIERATRVTAERRLILDHLGRYREVPRGRRMRYLPEWLMPDRRQRDILVQSARRSFDRARSRGARS